MQPLHTPYLLCFVFLSCLLLFDVVCIIVVCTHPTFSLGLAGDLLEVEVEGVELGTQHLRAHLKP